MFVQTLALWLILARARYKPARIRRTTLTTSRQAAGECLPPRGVHDDLLPRSGDRDAKRLADHPTFVGPMIPPCCAAREPRAHDTRFPRAAAIYDCVARHSKTRFCPRAKKSRSNFPRFDFSKRGIRARSARKNAPEPDIGCAPKSAPKRGKSRSFPDFLHAMFAIFRSRIGAKHVSAPLAIRLRQPRNKPPLVDGDIACGPTDLRSPRCDVALSEPFRL